MKKKSFYKISLLLLPVLFILITLYSNSVSGPRWISHNYDPQYAYLIASLSLAECEPEDVHIVHPGTPLQVFGAINIKLMQFIQGRDDPVDDVLRNPEIYLGYINTTMLILYGLTLLGGGLLIFIFTKNIWLSYFFQLTPLLSNCLMFSSIRVSPDSFLLFPVLLLLLITTLSIRFRIEEYLKLYVVLFAVVSGLGIATKFTFIPLILIPLFLLPAFKWRLYYLFGTIIGFIFFTLPIIGRYPEYVTLLKKFLSHAGDQAEKVRGLIEPYLSGLKQFFKAEPIFFSVLIITICVCSLSIIIPKCRKKIKRNATFRLLLAITATQVIQVLAIAKKPTIRYLIPGLGLSAISLGLLFQFIKEGSETPADKPLSGSTQKGHGKMIHFFNQLLRMINKKVHYCMVAVILIGIVPIMGAKITNTIEFKIKRTHESLASYRKIEKRFKNCSKVYYFRASSPVFALHVGMRWNEGKYFEKLYNIYHANKGDVYFYYGMFNPPKYFNLAGEQVEPGEIFKQKCIIFSGIAFKRTPARFKIPPLPLRKVYGRQFETIYGIRKE